MSTPALRRGIRAEVRERIALARYRYHRARWYEYRDLNGFGVLRASTWTDALVRALIARTRWVTLHELHDLPSSPSARLSTDDGLAGTSTAERPNGRPA